MWNQVLELQAGKQTASLGDVGDKLKPLLHLQKKGRPQGRGCGLKIKAAHNFQFCEKRESAQSLCAHFFHDLATVYF